MPQPQGGPVDAAIEATIGLPHAHFTRVPARRHRRLCRIPPAGRMHSPPSGSIVPNRGCLVGRPRWVDGPPSAPFSRARHGLTLVGLGLCAAGLVVSLVGLGLAIAGVDAFSGLLMGVGAMTMSAVVIGAHMVGPSSSS
jgi:hypothetical protein